MKQESLIPSWSFVVNEHSLNNIETLHLIFWHCGLCLAGFSSDNKLQIAKSFTVSKKSTLEDLKNILFNEPMVGIPLAVSKVWIVDERNILIPSHLFNKELSPEWLAKTHFISPNEKIFSEKIQGAQAVMLYPNNSELRYLLREFFPMVKHSHLSKAFIGNSTNATYQVDIVLLENTYLISIFDNNRLLNHQISTFSTIEDIVYAISVIADKYKISPNMIKATLAGFGKYIESYHTQLALYFPNLNHKLEGKSSVFTNFFNHIITCE